MRPWTQHNFFHKFLWELSVNRDKIGINFQCFWICNIWIRNSFNNRCRNSFSRNVLTRDCRTSDTRTVLSRIVALVRRTLQELTTCCLQRTVGLPLIYFECLNSKNKQMVFVFLLFDLLHDLFLLNCSLIYLYLEMDMGSPSKDPAF